MALLCYTAIVITVSLRHEVWRDEVRALSIVTDSSSVADLFFRLHNEGHPGLWHLLLYFGYHLAHTPLVLKVCSLGVAIAAVSVFLIYAPFARWQKALFLLGTFPLYEYSVMARNYGIGWLLLFCVAALYRKRHRRPLTFGLAAFLLAQTNAYCLIITFAVGVSFVLEAASRNLKRGEDGWHLHLNASTLASASLMILGGLLSVLQLLPGEDSKVHHPSPLSLVDTETWLRAIRAPLFVFGEGFGTTAPEVRTFNLWVTGLLFLLALSLLRRPFVFIIFAVGYTGMGVFAATVYEASLRHQGNAYMLLVATLWMAKKQSLHHPRPAYAWSTQTARIWDIVRTVGVTVLFLLQIPGAYAKIKFDLSHEMTSAAQFGKFMDAHPEYQNPIVITDPDYFFEALPYYAAMDIYLAREHKFKHYMNFTKANKDVLLLSEVMETARFLKETKKRPVLFVFLEKLRRPRPGRTESTFRNLRYDADSYKDFVENTRFLGEFRFGTPTGEDFDLYALR